MPPAVIPSPTQSVWHLGPVPLRAYALCIVLGIVAASVVTEIRMRRRGAPPNLILDIVVWAVPFGIVGARIYHVITSPGDYFGPDGDPVRVFQIWAGGIGIWGAVAGGALGVWLCCRRLGVPLRFVADALAPGLPLAQAIGRWGNYFNNELFGKATDLPWGLRIYKFADGAAERAVDTGDPLVRGVYHPTFLYESIWDLGVALLVWLLDRRYRFGRGRAFALYVAAYCLGRFWIEAMRSDEAEVFGGMRLNNWTALVVFVGAVAYFLRVRGPQERVVVGADGTMTLVAWDAPDPAPAGETDPADGTHGAAPAGTGAATAAADPPGTAGDTATDTAPPGTTGDTDAGATATGATGDAAADADPPGTASDTAADAAPPGTAGAPDGTDAPDAGTRPIATP